MQANGLKCLGIAGNTAREKESLPRAEINTGECLEWQAPRLTQLNIKTHTGYNPIGTKIDGSRLDS